MMSDEDEVSLVVKRDNPPPLKLRLLRKPRGNHSGHCMAQTSCEVVENDLWLVIGHLSMTLQTYTSLKTLYTCTHIHVQCTMYMYMYILDEFLTFLASGSDPTCRVGCVNRVIQKPSDHPKETLYMHRDGAVF